jgi:hypothetical protein
VHASVYQRGFTLNICETISSTEKIFSSESPIIKELVSDFSEEIFSSMDRFIPQSNILLISYLEGKLLPRELEEQLKNLQKSTLSPEMDKFKSALDDVINGKQPSYGRSFARRELAKKDPIAQVLNYASGVPEDASGIAYFYPENTENGQCIYKMAISSSTATGSIANDVMSGLLEANKIISAAGVTAANDSVAVLEKGIDLNQGNLKDINFFKVQGAKQNKFTGKTAYLRYQSRIEGLPDIFECDSSTCNIDRLRRGWSLVTSSCKGVQKPF